MIKKLNEAIAKDQGCELPSKSNYRAIAPDYCHSLDAIHEAVKTLTYEEWLKYHLELDKSTGPWEPSLPTNGRRFIEATALQRAIAYAKAKNLKIE